MKNSKLKIFVSVLLVFSVFRFPFSASAQVRAIYDRGSAGLGQQLKRLQTTASAMHTGAHPDDEDSGLLAYLARREMARTSYLALNRGEGGQNVIGSELFENLGVIRSEELLQARRLDGGQQFFTRVMDYGFSKTRAEAEKMWDAKQVLGDMVLAIRKFRPLVIIARFSGTPADGHGHHQLSGYLTPIAFKAAADPNQYPEQLKDGITTWQAKKLYVGQGFAPGGTPPSLILNPGEYDSIIGRSYNEIAAEGRSQHKTQEMGSLELRGRTQSGMRLLETLGDKVEKEASVFDGIDTSIKGIAKLSNNNEAGFAQKLADLQTTAETALKSYDVYAPEKLIPILATGYKQAKDAEMSTKNLESINFLQQKKRGFATALQMAASVTVDALSDSETIVAGDSVNVSVKTFAAENSQIKVKGASLKVPEGWKTETGVEPAAQENMFRPRRENAFDAKFFKVMSPVNAKPTQPYWLEIPKNKFTFNWDNEAAKNLPFQHPLLNAEVKLEIGGEEITVVKPIEYRYSDDIRGEIRRDVAVVPQVAVMVDSNLIIAPKSGKSSSHRLVLSVANNSPKETKGTLKLDLPAGWSSMPATADFALKARGEKTAVAFDVSIPANTNPNDYKITANANVNGQIFDHSQTTIAYPHIQTHYRFTKAEVSAKVLDLKISPVSIGYIMGSGDKVPEAIQRLGLNIQMLEEKDLATGDLSKFDVIVVGIRASQVRPDYVANNGRLLDYVKNGGTQIVQYQQNEIIRHNMLPFPAKMEAVVNGNQRISNLRVTDENANVTILDPKNAIFNFPNKITDADFDNWIQERSLYCLTDFAKEYTPLLSAADEGEEQINGGMLYAEIGKGKYLYSSYSWFRQLPVGNSGAYRIFANMLSLGAKKK